MKRSFFLFAAFSCFSLFALTPIVVAPKAPVYEETAARELAKYLGKIAAAEDAFRVVAESSVTPRISVGQTPAALEAFGLSNWNELKMDEVLYRVDDAGNLWIAGGGTRGTLYAVYEFLENEYGVRFFADDDELVPVQSNFSLPAPGTQQRYAPPFMVRALYYQQILYAKDLSFPVKMRHSFGGDNLPEWGGREEFIGFVHTFDGMLIPSAEYFSAHPEWFAFRDGQRQNCGQNAQLCLTNKEMRKEMIRKALAACAQYPERHFISISQNDTWNYCLCDQCQAFVEAHGNQTDLLMDCVNEVADAIAAQYPHIYVDTLAYQYTRQPPKTVMPHKNVVIRYCTIEARQLFRLDSPQNKDLYEELQAWKPVAPQMLIWNYVTSFSNYTAIHPNWANLAPDLRLFRECHAINLLEQGSWNHGGKAADLSDLRIYVLSRLMWNPDLDQQALVHEFCEHYYGAGAKFIYQYIQASNAAAARHPECEYDCFHPTADGFLSGEELAALWENIFCGAQSLQEDKLYGPRMAIAALPATMALLNHPELFDQDIAKRPEALREVNPRELLAWCRKVIPLAGLDAFAEHDQLDENGKTTVENWLTQTAKTYAL